MLHNFTVHDVLGSSAAALALTLFVFVPGYVTGWLTNAFHFRREGLVRRIVLSTPLGVAAVPVLVFFLGHWPLALWLFFGAVWSTFTGLAIREWLSSVAAMGPFRSPEVETEADGFHPAQSERLPRARAVKIGMAAVLGWALVAILSVSDLQLGHRLYFSVTAHDYSVRTAMTAAAARGIPPANPFFAARPPVRLRYHYFWMLVCALVTRLCGIEPRLALLGGTVWGGIALLSLIPIGLRYLAGVREGLRRTTLIGFALLAVTGLDLLPVLYISHFRAPVYADMEWWNVQITSWADVLLWTPHHVLALVACLVGFLALRQAAVSRRQRAMSVALAAVAFASACGLSTLVTVSFAVFAVLWLAVAACRGWWDELPLFLAAGTLAFLLALPALRLFLGPGASESPYHGFFGIAVREFPLAMRMLARHLGWRQHIWIANLLLLPVNYLFELGFFLLAAVLRLKANLAGKIPVTREETAAWTMVAASFLIGSFVRSNTLASNDIGWRCFLQAQFVFLLWGGVLLDRRRTDPAVMTPRVWLAARIMLLVGVLGTAYQVVVLRVYPVDYFFARGPDWSAAEGRPGERIFALRSVYEQLASILPPDAIIQYNPAETGAYISHVLYSGHPAAVGLVRCGAVFGGQLERCAPRAAAVDGLFDPAPGSIPVPDRVCRDYGISVLVAVDTDPVWKQPESWVWTRAPLIANPYVRAFRCGK
jgi:hypothetical protein